MSSEDNGKSPSIPAEADGSSGDDGPGANDSNGKKRKADVASGQTEEERKAERRAANRRSAFQSRQRRKILIEDLQKTVGTLSKENTELRNSNNHLRAKLETAMLENQLLRKQQGAPAGGTTPTGPGNPTPPATDGKGSTAMGATTQQQETSTTGPITTSEATNPAPAPKPSPIGNEGNNTPAPAPAPGNSNSAADGPTPAPLLAPGPATQGVATSQLLNGLTNLGGTGPPASAGADPLLAARLALAGNVGMNGIGGLNLANMGSLNSFNAIAQQQQQQQQNQTIQSLSNPAGNLGALAAVAAAGGAGGGGVQLQQQLAMLLGGGARMAAPPVGQNQQNLALLQSALGAAPAPNDSLGQAMRALSQMQQTGSTAGAAPK